MIRFNVELNWIGWIVAVEGGPVKQNLLGWDDDAPYSYSAMHNGENSIALLGLGTTTTAHPQTRQLISSYSFFSMSRIKWGRRNKDDKVSVFFTLVAVRQSHSTLSWLLLVDQKETKSRRRQVDSIHITFLDLLYLERVTNWLVG